MRVEDIALLVFSCVTANHLGLVEAMERVVGRRLPILNCVKCLSFWMVLLTTSLSGWNMIASLAVSFLSAYAAIWLELGMGFIDTLYGRLYEKIYSTTDECAAANAADGSDTEGGVPDVSEEQENI